MVAKGSDFETELKEEIIVAEPRRFKVILLNDDYSTMDFVVEVLMVIFNKNFDEALGVMLKVHNEGRGVCGIYPYDVAETKVSQVKKKAEESGFPLRAILEEC
ncbi:ATP-dependent Clp protease adaptor ClpS [Wolinella succinogenes]|uniref:ATP-dependent Clp protease adaptor ClpS n=1 Tax=Wolinella succinogenes TaxID=844 RepID=UPI00169CD941|nr:ATP-dependent Clp protease adaptor ClpS [Wolinella succinogenes]